MLIKVADAQLMMSASVDVRRIALGQKQARYVLTGAWDDRLAGSVAMYGEEWPWYADVDPEYVEGGRSNKILNANRQSKSRLLTGDVEPESQGVSRFTSACRKAWFKTRWRGVGNGNPWRAHMFRYFDNYHLYGTGWIYASLTQNLETGKDCADVKSVHSQNVLYDRMAVDPSTSPWVAVRHIMPVIQAEAWLKAEGIDPRRARENTEHVESVGFSQAYPVTVIIEFYSLAFAGHEATRMVFVRSFRDEPLKRTKNPWGNRLPLRAMVNNLLPGARYPAGLAFTALKTQVIINEIERGVLNRMRQPGITLWNDSKLNQQDVKNYMAGLNGGNIRLDGGAKDETLENLLMRVPGVALSDAEVEALSHFEQQFGEDSALTEIDQNSMLQSSRTLGEIQQMQSAGASNRAFDDQNVKEGLVSMCHAVFWAGKDDDDPCDITVDMSFAKQPPRQLTVNGGDGVDCKAMLERDGEIVIDVSALSSTDASAKRNNRLMELERIAAQINVSPQSQMKYGDSLIREAIMAIGEDPDDWAEASPMMQAAAAGQPIQGQPMTHLPNGAVPVPTGQPQVA